MKWLGFALEKFEVFLALIEVCMASLGLDSTWERFTNCNTRGTATYLGYNLALIEVYVASLEQDRLYWGDSRIVKLLQ